MGFAQKIDEHDVEIDEVCQKAEIISLVGDRKMAKKLLDAVPENRKNKHFKKVARSIDHQILSTTPHESRFAKYLFISAIAVTLMGVFQWISHNFTSFLWMLEQLFIN